MTPVSLKEIGIDFEMRKFKLGSDLSDKDKIMSSSGGAKAMAAEFMSGNHNFLLEIGVRSITKIITLYLI